EYIKVYENLNIPFTNKVISYDSANGSTYKIAKKIVEQYASNTFQIGNEPDGLNINRGVGSTHIEAIKSKVLETKSSIGLSFDGDGDRILVVDGNQNLYDGDLIVYTIAKYLKSIGKLKNNKVVLDRK